MALDKVIKVKPKGIRDALEQEAREALNFKRVRKAVYKQIGDEFTGQMIDIIQGGTSPVNGKAFPKYKNPKKYPGKRKASRPVNLTLTGQMLDSLKNEAVIGDTFGLRIFYGNRKAQLKEQGHAEGHNGQPKRRTIPASNQSFSKALINYFNKLITRLLIPELEK